MMEWPPKETSLEVTFERPGDYPDFPASKDNLVLRAAALLRGGRAPGARITLHKRIPMGSGLAGGSADAAAAIHGLDELWGLGITPEQKLAAALELGSDVPFCVAGGTALCRGRGEIMQALRPRARLRCVLAYPGVQVSTARVFSSLASAEAGGAGETAARAQALVASLEAGEADALQKGLFNRLQETAISLHRELGEFRRRLAQAGLEGAVMTGSGSCFFGLAAEADHAERIARRIMQMAPGSRAWAVESCE